MKKLLVLLILVAPAFVVTAQNVEEKQSVESNQKVSQKANKQQTAQRTKKIQVQGQEAKTGMASNPVTGWVTANFSNYSSDYVDKKEELKPLFGRKNKLEANSKTADFGGALAGITAGQEFANFSLGTQAFMPWDDFVIYPIQFNSEIQMDFANMFQFPETVKIWDAENEKVNFELEMQGTTAKLIVEDLAPGLYQVELVKEGSSKFFQIAIQ